MLRILVFALALTVIGLRPVAADMVVTDLVAYDCTQAGPERLHCSYHWLSGGRSDRIAATVGGQTLPAPASSAYPSGGTVSILFLVDTSDPRREPVIDSIRAQLKTLVDAADPHWRLGLAVFDSNLRVLAPLGSSAADILSKAGSMKAVGMTTELYRSALEGLRLLAEDRSDRKALYMFSDGLAEDLAYHHEDVIAKARAAGIPVVTLGYARTVALSVGLQTLRKLSEDSGGRFVEAGIGRYTLPEEFLKRPYALLDSDQRLDVDLRPAMAAGLTGKQDVRIHLYSGGQEALIEAGISLPKPTPPAFVNPPAPAAAAGQAAVPPPISAAPVSAPTARISSPVPAVAPTPAPPGKLDSWLWYGTPAAFLLAVLVALVVYGRLARRRESSLLSTSVPASKPYAYLIQQGTEPLRHIIAQTPWRIGRAHNNELAIDDQSISRQHAEIHRRRDGKFEIVDMESMNGVFINEKKVKQGALNEGDVVDIGDVTFKFTRFDDDQSAQEKTVMIRTRTT